MKANELMVGDWVRPVIPNIIHCRINSVERLCCLEECEIDIEPIPITPEILEKNGFAKESFVSSTNYFCNYNESIIKAFQRYGEEDVYVNEIAPHVPSSPVIIGARFKYVHELQHALRLCKIDKEIIL